MYGFKINNKKSLAVEIVFFSIFIALTIRLFFLMIKPTSTVQGELENHQVEYTSDKNYKIFDTNGESLINYKNKYGRPYESCTKETPDEFYKSLPLSSKLRPNWDESYLKQLGYDNIKIDKNIIEKVYDEREMALYACTPLFKIVATKNKTSY